MSFEDSFLSKLDGISKKDMEKMSTEEIDHILRRLQDEKLIAKVATLLLRFAQDAESNPGEFNDDKEGLEITLKHARRIVSFMREHLPSKGD